MPKWCCDRKSRSAGWVKNCGVTMRVKLHMGPHWIGQPWTKVCWTLRKCLEVSLTRRVLQSLVNLLAPGELILLNSHKEGSFYAVLTDSRAFPILSRNSCCFPSKYLSIFQSVFGTCSPWCSLPSGRHVILLNVTCLSFEGERQEK